MHVSFDTPTSDEETVLCRAAAFLMPVRFSLISLTTNALRHRKGRWSETRAYASAVDSRRKDDRRQRAFHAIDRSDLVDQIVQLGDRGGGDDGDQVE